MTKDEASKMTLEQAQALPWDTPVFLHVPGRYYVGMYNVRLPKVLNPPYGGDVTALLWRYNEVPEEWVFIYRFRWYETPADDPEGKDRKSWYAGKIKGTEQEAEAKARQLMRLLSGSAVFATKGEAAPLDFLEMRGDHVKAMQAMRSAGKPWLHFTGTKKL